MNLIYKILSFVFLLFLSGCLPTDYSINHKDVGASAITERYKMLVGTYHSTSKAGTVLQIPTVYRLNVETGEICYTVEGKENLFFYCAR